MGLQTTIRQVKLRLRPLWWTLVLSLLLAVVLYALFTSPVTGQRKDLDDDVEKRDLVDRAEIQVQMCNTGAKCSPDVSEAEPKTIGYRSGSDVMASIFRSSSKAVCIGSNASLGEVEDLLCMPKPDYVPEMKNPCWWDVQNRSAFPADRDLDPDPDLRGRLTPAPTVRSLSCLPYFHILCCSKCGTTDLYRRISMHPDIVPNFGQFGKERLYWSWAMYGVGYKDKNPRGEPAPFFRYTKGFGILARYLEDADAKGNTRDLHRLVTLDGSPADMWDLRGWIYLPQNRGLRHPAVTTPHLLRHLYRDPKFIVLAREPVERIYTAYLFHGLGSNPHDFHEDTTRAIAMMNQCLALAQDRIECFVNDTIVNRMPVDLHYSCYAVFYEEWLKVFPRKHFLFLRTEDYSQDIRGSLYKIFRFLDLTKPSPRDLEKMVAAPVSYHTKARDVAGPMLEQTRRLLQQWFLPWNRELARLMDDKGYLWDYAR